MEREFPPDCKYLNLAVYNLELCPIIKYRLVQCGIPLLVTAE